MSTQCPACSHNNLTVTGLSQHLAKSHNPHCQVLYHQSHSEIHANEPFNNLANDPYYEPDTDGGYGEDESEFVWPGDLELVDADDDASDDGLNVEPEWEPTVEAVEEDNNHRQHGCTVMPYPDPCTGQEITNRANCYAANEENLYHPFSSKMDWEVTRWAKLCGLSSTAFSDLLAIKGVSEHLSLSFKNANELNAIIIVTGEAFDVYYCDVIDCVRSLYGDPDFARYLAFVPEQHYADEDEMVHLFHDMHTGKWWWDAQKKLDCHSPGSTIISIIISSDKTQVTLFCNKSIYPVYLTIGNIPKEIQCKPSRSAHILLAYLLSSWRQTMVNLYHACLSHVLAPLKSVGLDGLCMASEDGALHQCHPLFASFVGNYPEQLLATGIKFGECPKCDIDADEMGSNTTPFHLQKLNEVLDALAALNEGNLSFVHACSLAGIKPIVHPFWEDLPFTNIFCVITPDVLHQLYQGLIKHL
ncbi:hypothetical protein F4604DRAFT_1877587 [Suillus subluteus]|nr:hypothetical protein F4604DRAFT_1877587 [Suillus subluteus]